jgi:flavodoxin
MEEKHRVPSEPSACRFDRRNEGMIMTATLSIAIVYASVHHGNTRQLAEALSAELSADRFTVEEAKNVDLSQYALVGIGSGIYFGRHHQSLLDWVDSWKEAPQRTFLFSTAGLPFLWWFLHAALRNRLTRKGCSVLSEFCCRGWDTVGPLWLVGGINRKHPNARDLDRARDFARQFKASDSAS